MIPVARHERGCRRRRADHRERHGTTRAYRIGDGRCSRGIDICNQGLATRRVVARVVVPHLDSQVSRELIGTASVVALGPLEVQTASAKGRGVCRCCGSKQRHVAGAAHQVGPCRSRTRIGGRVSGIQEVHQSRGRVSSRHVGAFQVHVRDVAQRVRTQIDGLVGLIGRPRRSATRSGSRSAHRRRSTRIVRNEEVARGVDIQFGISKVHGTSRVTCGTQVQVAERRTRRPQIICLICVRYE